MLRWRLRLSAFHSSPASSELAAPGLSLLASISSAGSCFPDDGGFTGLLLAKSSVFFCTIDWDGRRTSGDLLQNDWKDPRQ